MTDHVLSPNWLAGGSQFESKVEFIEFRLHCDDKIFVMLVDVMDTLEEFVLYEQRFLQTVVEEMFVYFSDQFRVKVHHGHADCMEAQCQSADCGFANGQDDGTITLDCIHSLLKIEVTVVDTSEV